jgi:hypothetical protein
LWVAGCSLPLFDDAVDHCPKCAARGVFDDFAESHSRAFGELVKGLQVGVFGHGGFLSVLFGDVKYPRFCS